MNAFICDFTGCAFFFFTQKMSYDVRISDWSSDVCSSDLLGHKIEAGAVSPRSALAKARNTDIDYFGVNRLDAFVVDAKALDGARAIVFDNDVRCLGQLVEGLLVFFSFKVQGNSADRKSGV